METASPQVTAVTCHHHGGASANSTSPLPTIDTFFPCSPDVSLSLLTARDWLSHLIIRVPVRAANHSAFMHVCLTLTSRSSLDLRTFHIQLTNNQLALSFGINTGSFHILKTKGRLAAIYLPMRSLGGLKISICTLTRHS